MPTVLFVDDDESLLDAWRRGLAKEPFTSLFANGFEAALIHLEQRAVDVVVCDERFPNGSGWELLETIHKEYPRTMRVMITGSASAVSVVAGINRGQIYRLLLKPCPQHILLETIHGALEQQSLKDRLRHALAYLERVNTVIGAVSRNHPVEYHQALASLTLPSTAPTTRELLDEELADGIAGLAQTLQIAPSS